MYIINTLGVWWEAKEATPRSAMRRVSDVAKSLKLTRPLETSLWEGFGH